MVTVAITKITAAENPQAVAVTAVEHDLAERTVLVPGEQGVDHEGD